MPNNWVWIKIKRTHWSNCSQRSESDESFPFSWMFSIKWLKKCLSCKYIIQHCVRTRNRTNRAKHGMLCVRYVHFSYSVLHQTVHTPDIHTTFHTQQMTDMIYLLDSFQFLWFVSLLEKRGSLKTAKFTKISKNFFFREHHAMFLFSFEAKRKIYETTQPTQITQR